MRRFVLAAGAATIVMAVAIPVWSAGRATSSSTTAVIRAIQRNGGWTFACGGDTCIGTVLDPLIVETPLGVDALDVEVTLTLDYRTSPKDIGLEGAPRFAELPLEFLSGRNDHDDDRGDDRSRPQRGSQDGQPLRPARRRLSAHAGR